ncbi:hypothetical protein [Deinococcus fonticola]|uniref:hypothetical protein n=1 Tax=Deinococcus fonticola TaxID=2528713 RepID=UPI001074DA65|nr:hypothetical protein [Deinococcus fonticola]
MSLPPNDIMLIVSGSVAALGTLWATFGKPRQDSAAALQERIQTMLKEQSQALETRLAALEAERDNLETRLEAVERELNDMRYDLRTWQDYGRDVIAGRFASLDQAVARARELLSRVTPPGPTP